MKTRFALYAALLLLTQCSGCKDDPTPADPASQLPPATRTGANTFGCLVNGQLYTPKGNAGTSNLYSIYQAGYLGGFFSISVDRIENNNQIFLDIQSSNVIGLGEYSFDRPNGTGRILYSETQPLNGSVGCRQIADEQDIIYRTGHLTFSRFDPVAGIASGTFDITLLPAGCDTLKLTQGRFDVRL